MAYNSMYDPYSYMQPYQYATAATNPFMRNYQQPQPPVPPQQQTYAGFQWVRGEAAAKAFRAEPGQTVLLMDSDEPVLYVNSTDVTGKPAPMITYDLVERTTTATKTETRQDFSEFAKKADVQSVMGEYAKKDEIEEFIKSCVVKAVDDKMRDLRFTASTVPVDKRHSKDAVEL